MSPPSALVVGATGNIGKEVVRLLQDKSDDVTVVAATRSAEKKRLLEDQGIKARVLDLDDTSTFASALEGIDRAFLLTGYSVAFLKQSKGFLDAAKTAGVRHIVHLGASSFSANEIDHFSWHHYVEAYIENLGFSWTHLHPEAFMQNIFNFGMLNENGDRLTHCLGDAVCTWVDGLDVAAVAAEAMAYPDKYQGKVIPMAYDLKSMADVAKVLSDTSGKEVAIVDQTVDEFAEGVMKGGGDLAYVRCLQHQFALQRAGVQIGADTTFDNFEEIVGRAPSTWKTFAAREKGVL